VSVLQRQWAFNPEDSAHIDQFLETDESKNEILMALNGFKKLAENNLGAKILTDE
jgi:hypothetical protein